MTEGELAPRVARRIVCGYQRELLPTWWLQVHRWVKTRLERERALVQVDLLPVSDLPADVDLLIVAPEVLHGARENAPSVECVAITPDDYPRQVTEILARLRDRGWYAVEDPSVSEVPKPRIVRHVGYERVDHLGR